MSDLILNLNLNESIKKGKLIIETYEGVIPKLKSKQYSGQLRNVNINAVVKAGNLNEIQLNLIKGFLNKSFNLQISKYQYILSNLSICEMDEFIKMECLFYKDKKSRMFQIEHVEYNGACLGKYTCLEGLKIGVEKTSLYIVLESIELNQSPQIITPIAYIDIKSTEHPLKLVFDYDTYLVNYDSKERVINGEKKYRNYNFEEKIIDLIRSCGWKYKKTGELLYLGQSISQDIEKLISNGVSVFTNNEKKIVKGDFSQINVSYNIDWFEIEGNVQIEGEGVKIYDLINLRQKKEFWVELNEKVIFLPQILSSKIIEKDKKCESLKLKKRYISSAIELAYGLGKKTVEHLDEIVAYEKIILNINEDIYKTLRNYQKTGVRWLLSLRKNGFGGCLADDMGLGKTLQIIAYLSDISMNNTHNLIIVPKTLLINWKNEFDKFLPGTSLYLYHGGNRDIKCVKDKKVIITTYGTVLNDIEIFSDLFFNSLIIDEAQYIKNEKTKIYRVIKKIKAETKLLLTGTPVENNIREYWGLMRLVNEGFLEKYTELTKNHDEDVIIGKIKRVTAPFLLRRMKQDVLSDLPIKQEQILYCRMESSQQELYDMMLESIKYEISRESDQYEIKSRGIMLNGLLYLQEICCHPSMLNKGYNYNNCTVSAKLELLMDLLHALYRGGNKVVVFSRFTKMLKIIERKVFKAHYNCFYLDGKTTKRIQLIDEFENSPEGIFLISLKAGGTGINLVSANTVVIFDPWWNPAIEKQAEDRIYRIGQKNNIMIYRLITEGTIEEKIQQLQDEKKELYSKILNGNEIPVSMNVDVMKKLIWGE